MYIRNGFFLCLIYLVLQSCSTTYRLLPENIRNRSDIEGVYSNESKIDTLKNIGQTIDGVFHLWWEIDSLKHKAFHTKTIWNMFDRKREIMLDDINVKIEIVNSKRLKFSFFENDKCIGVKLLKGKFKKDECFYTRRRLYIVPILPMLWWYENGQERIFRVDDDLIIETTYSFSVAVIIMASGNDENKIWKFKQIEKE